MVRILWHKDVRYLLTLGSVIIGLLFVLLIKANADLGGSVVRTDIALPSLVQTEQENQQLANDNEKLRQELAKYSQGQNASALAEQQLLAAKKNADLTLLNGPGLQIILDDSKRKASGIDMQNYVIHEAYIRQLINILWNGGAEAIAINDQRVTSNTEVFCSGSFIQINGTRQMPPYIITAIGDTYNLQSALKFYVWDQLGDFQKQYGITRNLDIIDNITIPAGKFKTFQYAVPVKEGQ
ncbi:MAG: DUF881 domain-containing protein [Desulfitobacteriaceae bacterium]